VNRVNAWFNSLREKFGDSAAVAKCGYFAVVNPKVMLTSGMELGDAACMIVSVSYREIERRILTSWLSANLERRSGGLTNWTRSYIIKGEEV